MDFELPDETKALKELVRRLVEKYQMPLEQKLLRGEEIVPADLAPGRAAAREAGLWGLGLPSEYGGANLSTSAAARRGSSSG
jgi:acyl-CoA dehydrogenase